MAVVNHIPTLPGFKVPAIMPSFHGVAPELTTPAFKDKIYVAPRKDVKEGKAKLVWTMHRSGGHVKICIIHVLVPSQTIPVAVGHELVAAAWNRLLRRLIAAVTPHPQPSPPYDHFLPSFFLVSPPVDAKTVEPSPSPAPHRHHRAPPPPAVTLSPERPPSPSPSPSSTADQQGP
ncbi:hypothetical protein NL676_010630 [Syzygium grande]|nr:hypothetical protein NL676_010630 [Syzygium grande]